MGDSLIKDTSSIHENGLHPKSKSSADRGGVTHICASLLLRAWDGSFLLQNLVMHMRTLQLSPVPGIWRRRKNWPYFRKTGLPKWKLQIGVSTARSRLSPVGEDGPEVLCRPRRGHPYLREPVPECGRQLLLAVVSSGVHGGQQAEGGVRHHRLQVRTALLSKDLRGRAQ